MAARAIINLDQGCEFIERCITNLTSSLDGSPDQFNLEESMYLYTTIYNMCTQKPPHDYSYELYVKYKEAFENYINSTVVASIREKQGEVMLRELVKRWSNHKTMVKWMSRFFNYVERYYVNRRSLPTLNEVALECFRDLAYQQVNAEATDALIVLIEREREGEEIDRELVKNVINIYVEIGIGSMELYEKDFEARMLEDTVAYYSRKASIWISEDSFPDYYILKLDECLKKERDRVSHYLHSSTEPKLLKAMKEVFEIKCNKTGAGSSIAELLATFCDNILNNGGTEKLSDEAIQQSLDKAVKLLAYINDKDLFAECYRNKLAHRLVSDRSSVNDERERSFLAKLKQQFGGEFTSKMEEMLI